MQTANVIDPKVMRNVPRSKDSGGKVVQNNPAQLVIIKFGDLRL